MEYTTSEVFDAFADWQMAQGLAPTTAANRQACLNMLERAIPNILEATTFDLRRFLGREDLAQGTRRTYRNCIRAFYAFLKDEGIRENDPAAKLPMVRVPRGEPRPFTPEQVAAMLNSGAYRDTRAMILLGFHQGFRVSQIAQVRGEDIDLMTDTISTLAKGSKTRRLPLHPVVRELAQTMPREGYWFPARGQRNGHIHSRSVTDLITKAKRRAGIDDPLLTPHSLRHGFATALVEADVDVLVIQKLMLHESVETTQIYAGVSQRRRTAGIRSLTGLDIPKQSSRGARPTTPATTGA